MPADPRRHLVAVRLFPEQLKKLDAVVLTETNRRGKIVHRGQVLTEWIEERYSKLSPRDRARVSRSA